MRKYDRMMKAIGLEVREHKSSFVVYTILRVLVIVCLVRQFANQNYENVFLCVLTLLLLLVPSFLQVNLKIELPTTLEIIILLFVFAAEILGEIEAFYLRIPNWDTILHTMNGFLMAAIGFSLVDILNRDARLKFTLSPLFMAIVAFCFSMTVGVLWEFFEFGMDQFFGLDMQKDTVIHTIQSVALDPTQSNRPVVIRDIQDVMVNGQRLGVGGYLDIGLLDTMEDLLVNFVGAVVFSVLGFFYMKQQGKKGFASRFIPALKDESADYLKLVDQQAQEAQQAQKVQQVPEPPENTQ